MKSKFIAILLACLCVFLLCTGCGMGTYFENDRRAQTSDPSDPSGAVGPDNPTENDETHYTVTVYFGSAAFAPPEGADITVVWRSKNDVVRVPLGTDGKADAGELDGTYSVYLTGLPSVYTYDPNGYTATSSERKVSILLTSVREPDSGDGSNMYTNNGCYTVRDDGTYRVNVASENASLFYEYKPRSAGVYSIVSWVNVYDDQINPLFHLYLGNSQNKWFSRTLDGGGAASDGGFTKNFRYEFSVSANEVGNVCTFAVGATTRSHEYPVYVDFAITYIGDYVSDYMDIRPQAAKQARGKTAERKPGQEYVYADMGTKLYDASKFRLSPNTGRYHVYDQDKYADNPYGYGVGYGPMLLCDITAAMPSYRVVDSLYAAVSVGPSASNYLMLYNMWVEEEQKFATFDYTDFIRIDYYGVCNSDGRCYVTEELRVFLQKFAENHSLYTDGVGPGENTPEDAGYSANQDALWLFACGFYE